MTLKSRLLATVLAISLSTPAAAVTFMLNEGNTFYIQGIEPTPHLGDESFFNGFRLKGYLTITLVPMPPLIQVDNDPISFWEYDIFMKPSPSTFSEGAVWGVCYSKYVGCFPEFSPEWPLHGDGFVTFNAFWSAAGIYAGSRPQFQLDFNLPEGITISHMPLPASWLLFASVLGLGGLFRWAKHRVVA